MLTLHKLTAVLRVQISAPTFKVSLLNVAFAQMRLILAKVKVTISG